MADYLLLMHDDAPGEVMSAWPPYLDRLAANGRLRGGSAIGEGMCVRRDGAERAVTARLSGFVRIVAESLEDAATCLEGNPVYEAGGTVEIRHLPETD